MGSKEISLKRKERIKERDSLLIKSVEELTVAKSLFRDKKSSGCLMRFRASMSLGRRRGHSKTSAIW